MGEGSTTLPIDTTAGLSMDEKAAQALGAGLVEQYTSAAPFPHIVMNDFLPVELAEKVLANFPFKQNAGDTFYEEGYAGHHKRQVYPGDCEAWNREFFAFLNSAPVLQFLEGLTGIKGLVADPYFAGGGFHEIRAGGRLGIHADFRINERLNLQRRLNLLIYLNKDWQSEWGGELELWDTGMKAKARSVLPLFNRAVVFNTDARSYHGHPDPLACPAGVTRKSVALYYYTASDRIYEDVPKLSTMYQARPGDSAELHAEARKLRLVNHLSDWVPPVVFRAVRRAKNLVGR